MSLAHPRIQHPQVIVDLRHRADRRAGVLAGGLLRDRDRRAQPGDQIDVGLGHLAEELAGEARQALHVPPLPLGIEGVEGQRTLPRPADPGEADQPVPRQDEADVPQVMLAGALDEDIGVGHRVAPEAGGSERSQTLHSRPPADRPTSGDRKLHRILPSCDDSSCLSDIAIPPISRTLLVFSTLSEVGVVSAALL